MLNDAQKQQLVSLRHALHQLPELSFEEHQTSQRLYDILATLSPLSLDRVAKTGIVARIKGLDSNAPIVAIRGDIDALPIQEETGLSFASTVPGVMHACGHDVHASWAVGAAMLLSEHPANGDVIIILQPAEEIAKGAKLILESGILPSISAIFGGHVDRCYPVGTVVVHEGAISSFSDTFCMTVSGRSAHAARPEEGCSPIPEIALLIDKIQQIQPPNKVDQETNIITITQVHSGKRYNIIPDQGHISGTIRCLSESVRSFYHDELRQCCQLNQQEEISIHCDITSGSPAIINDPSLKPAVMAGVSHVLGEKGMVSLHKPNLASEDFGFYCQQFPGWFLRFGARFSDDPFIPGHSPHFYAEDETIFVGAETLAEIARQASSSAMSR